jgi:hypothetical protein
MTMKLLKKMLKVPNDKKNLMDSREDRAVQNIMQQVVVSVQKKRFITKRTKDLYGL